MPFCGYDPLMGVGVSRFAEGLSKSMGERAERLALSLPAQLAEEKDELFILAHFMERELENMAELDPRRRQLEAFTGIAYLARYLMGLNEALPPDRKGFDTRIGRNAKALDKLMFDFERAFESSPREWATLDRIARAFGEVFPSNQVAASEAPHSHSASIHLKTKTA